MKLFGFYAGKPEQAHQTRHNARNNHGQIHNHLQTQKRSQREIKQNQRKQKAANMADFLRNMGRAPGQAPALTKSPPIGTGWTNLATYARIKAVRSRKNTKPGGAYRWAFCAQKLEALEQTQQPGGNK